MTQAITSGQKITFEEYLLIPYDGRRTEFVNGEIIEMTEPSLGHIKLTKALGMLIDAYLAEQGLPWACFSGPGVAYPRPGQTDGVRDPDLVVATNDQWQIIERQTKALFLKRNPPLLVVEIVSPGTVKTHTHDKRADYADAQVPEYWIVNPVDGYVSVWLLDGRIYRLKGEFKDGQRVESLLLAHWEVSAGRMLGDLTH